MAQACKSESFIYPFVCRANQGRDIAPLTLLDVKVWEILNLRLRMRNAFRDRLNHVFQSYSIDPANSSVGRASDCSSEGRRFEPDLVDIKTR